MDNYLMIWLKITPKLRKNCAEKRDAGGTQNWPRSFVPRPVLGGGGVAFFRAIYAILRALARSSMSEHATLRYARLLSVKSARSREGRLRRAQKVRSTLHLEARETCSL